METKFDNICKRCGACCHAYFEGKDRKYYIKNNYQCPYLGKNNVCSVYNDRFEKNPMCLPIDKALRQGIVADDCPYIEYFGLKDYKGKRALLFDSDLKKV